MLRHWIVTGLVCAAMVGGASAQTKKPAPARKPAAAPKVTTYDITVRADQVYTGTVAMALDRGKVTGDMRMTHPMEITGKVAGTAKEGVLSLKFPFYMVEQKCEGVVSMTITMPQKPGLAKGTMEAITCEGEKLPGDVELVPAAEKKQAP